MVPFNVSKHLKDRRFEMGGLKNFKLPTNIFFGVSFQKNILSIFLLFSSVCYQDDLSYGERNEMASSRACTFNKTIGEIFD